MGRADEGTAGQPSPAVQALWVDFANSWGEMGSAWGVPGSAARVHGLLLVSRRPWALREIEAALGLAHPLAVSALRTLRAWGLVEVVPVPSGPRPPGRRGPLGQRYAAIADQWTAFRNIVATRKRREGDPVMSRLDAVLARAETLADDPEGRRTRDWLREFAGFVGLFNRAVGLIADLDPALLARLLRLLGQLSDETVRALLERLAAIPDNDLLALAEAARSLSPDAARELARLAARAARSFAEGAPEPPAGEG